MLWGLELGRFVKGKTIKYTFPSIVHMLTNFFPFKILNLCSTQSFTILLFVRFRATLYQCPETAAERQNMANAVNNRIADLQTVLRTTEEHSHTQLQEIAQEIDIWQQKVTILTMYMYMYSTVYMFMYCVFVFYKSYLIFFF